MHHGECRKCISNRSKHCVVSKYVFKKLTNLHRSMLHNTESAGRACAPQEIRIECTNVPDGGGGSSGGGRCLWMRSKLACASLVLVLRVDALCSGGRDPAPIYSVGERACIGSPCQTFVADSSLELQRPQPTDHSRLRGGFWARR